MSESKLENGQCTEKLSRIYEYLDGQLSCEDLSELDAHLADCEHCAQEYDLECLIRSVVKRSCCEQAPADLKNKILNRIDTIKENEHRE